MKPLPLPLRVAAGLAVTARERAKELPKQLTGLPITVASQVLQLSMRVQQQVTELAIKGDDALSALRPVEDNPSWAVFDEDVAKDFAFDQDAEPAWYDSQRPTNATNSASVSPLRTSRFDAVASGAADAGVTEPPDPWEEEEKAIAQSEQGEPSQTPPGWLANYDELSLPQLRARLRKFSREELAELLAYERATADRPEFSGMLARRIETVAKQAQNPGAPANGNS